LLALYDPPVRARDIAAREITADAVRSGVEKALYESAGEAQFENGRLRTALKELRKQHANQDRDYQRVGWV